MIALAATQPTTQQQALFARYGAGSIPFVDIGNRYLLPQVQYDPSALAGLTWAQVAAAMRDPSTPSPGTSTAPPT